VKGEEKTAKLFKGVSKTALLFFSFTHHPSPFTSIIAQGEEVKQKNDQRVHDEQEDVGLCPGAEYGWFFLCVHGLVS
jgi:hypothetical protein